MHTYLVTENIIFQQHINEQNGFLCFIIFSYRAGGKHVFDIQNSDVSRELISREFSRMNFKMILENEFSILENEEKINLH